MATQFSKDDQLIYFAAEYQLVTHQHLVTLTQRHAKAIWRSLPRLVKRGLLYCRAQGMYKPNVYSTFDIRRRENFKHDLMVTDIHVAITATGLLLDWTQPREKLKGAFNEDARLELGVPMNDRQGRLTLYLEADTGTEPSWMIDEKFKRYLARREERFNVLFVFEDARRASTMARRAERVLLKDKPSTWKFFLFTTLEEITTNPRGQICHVAYDPAKYPVVPNLIK